MIVLRAERNSTDTGDRIELHLRGDALPPQLQSQPIFFEIEGSDAADPSILDGYLGSVIHFAMEHRQPLHVEGRLTRGFLRHISKYQEYWSSVSPERNAIVRISADELVDDIVQDLPAVAAYSGGVDSAFTLLRHAKGLIGMDTLPLTAVMVVQGLDTTLQDKAGFALLLDRLQPVIEELNLKRYVARTNSKELNLQFWRESYAAQLEACLYLVSHRHSHALIASGGYGTDPNFERSGNQISVPLLSNDHFAVRCDAPEYGRTEKVALIAQYPTVRRAIRVCWEGADVFRNCGRCRKCLLTYMNFRAAGVERPECFDTPISDDLVGNYELKNRADASYHHELLSHLRQRPELAELTARVAAPLLRFEAEQQTGSP